MSVETEKLVKAKLKAISPEDPNLDIKFMFNPTEVSFTRTIDWKSNPGNRGETLLPKVNFSGVSPYKFTLSGLLFDTYETKENVVLQYVNKIKQGVEAPPSKQGWRPPVYIFQWGDSLSFHCVVTSFTYELTMFLADGTPVRAMVDIALQEVDPKEPFADKKSASKGKQRTAHSSSKKLGPADQPPAN